MRLDPQIVRQQIANLAIAYPDLATNDEDWSLALSSETELDEILTQVVRMIENSKAFVEGTDLRMEELATRQMRFKRRIEAYRSLLMKLMEAAGVPKRELAEATISLRAVAPKVVGDADADFLPDDLVVIERRPNKAAIKAALEAGQVVKGYELSNGGQTISIRVK